MGIDKDINGGMTDTGKIIRDAWVFGLIEETETCEGWLPQGIEDLWGKVSGVGRVRLSGRQAADGSGERFLRVQNEAVKRAREAGWDPELPDDD